MRGRDAAGDRARRARLAARTRSNAGGGGDLAEVEPRAGLLRQHQVARDRQRLGDRGRGGQAEPGRGLARGRDRAARPARHPRHARSPPGRGRGHRRARARITPESAIQPRPVPTARAPADAADRHLGESTPASPRVAAAIGWIHRSGLPISAARWTMPGSSSTGDWSGISATRTMPPARQAARSTAKTPRSTMAGASMLAARSRRRSASAGASTVPIAAIAPSRTSSAAGHARRRADEPGVGEAASVMPSPPRRARGG